jgi:hypothetical protein
MNDLYRMCVCVYVEREKEGSCNNFEVWGEPQICQKSKFECTKLSWEDFLYKKTVREFKNKLTFNAINFWKRYNSIYFFVIIGHKMKSPSWVGLRLNAWKKVLNANKCRSFASDNLIWDCPCISCQTWS